MHKGHRTAGGPVVTVDELDVTTRANVASGRELIEFDPETACTHAPFDWKSSSPEVRIQPNRDLSKLRAEVRVAHRSDIEPARHIVGIRNASSMSYLPACKHQTKADGRCKTRSHEVSASPT